MLGGELGKKYGTQHEYYNLRTPADAIKLLCINYPEFQRDLITAHQRGVGYKVIQGTAFQGYDEIHLPFGSKPMMIVPVIAGSGGDQPITQILVGVGLVAAAFVIGPAAGGFLGIGAGLGGATGAGAAISMGLVGGGFATAVGALGASLIFAGTASLISPQPEVPKPSRLGDGTRARGTGPQGITRGATGMQSYVFTGPANTVGTGATVPVIYGRVITGGHLIASNLEVVDESDPHLESIGDFDRGEVQVNGEKITKEFREVGGVPTKRLGSGFNFPSDRDKDRRIPLGIKPEYSRAIFGPNLERKVDEESSSLSFELDREDSLKYKRDSRDKLKKLDVVLRLDNGLFDFPLDENSTKFPAFISYRIEIRFGGGGSQFSNVVVASCSATIQGMFNSSQRSPYYYVHRLEVGRGAQKPDQLKIHMDITGAECRDETTLMLVGYGYDLV